MILKQRDRNFYEKYGINYSSPDRRQTERIASSYKVSRLCPLMEELRLKRILDFGCGLGDALDILARHFHVINAIGIDISSTMIAYAKKEYPQYTFIRGNREKLKKYRVDLVIFFDVLEHLEDIPGILRLAKSSTNYIGIKIPLEKTWLIFLLNSLRLSKRKSSLYNSEGHLYQFNRKEVDVILKQGGLKILKTRTEFLPKKIRFSTYMKNHMRAKSGRFSRLKYYAYLTLSKFPYRVTSPLFQLVNGPDFFVLCQAEEKIK